jgi:hypothetical protein
MTTIPPAPAWQSLGSTAAPPSLGDDLLTVRQLEPKALGDLWTLLEPNLGARVADEAGERAESFCAAHGVRADDLVPLVRACRFLFRTAAQQDVPLEAMSSDLTAVLGTSPEAAALAGLYARALPHIRALEVLASLERFGPVLRSAAVRVDHVGLTQHLPATLPLVLLHLEYEDDAGPHKLTLHLPPAALAALRQLLGAPH